MTWMLGRLLVVDTLAWAEDTAPPVPLHRLSKTNLTVVRQNPEGLQDDFKLTYRYRLYGENPGLLFNESEIITGATTYWTPAFVRAGGRVGIRPWRRKSRGPNGLDGFIRVLGHVMGFSLASDASDGAREERRGGPDGEIATTGHLTTLTAELRGKVGDIVARSRAWAIRPVMELEEGDTVSYEGVNDILMPQDGWALHMDNDVLWMGPNGWVAGVRHSMDHVFYPDADAHPSSVGRGDLNIEWVRLWHIRFSMSRVRPSTSPPRPHSQLALEASVSNGRGDFQAIPYGLVAFAFSGDLLRSGPNNV